MVKEPKYTITSKIKGKRYCNIGDNKVKKKLNNVLQSMIWRCYSPKREAYINYGRKGITVCDEWLGINGLDKFYEWSINNGYNIKNIKNGYNTLTIDRIDNTKGYSPDNCRWVTRLTQANNKTNNLIVEFNGEKDTLSNFCRKQNLDYHAVFLRIYRRKWSVEKALSTPIIKRGKDIYNS